MTSLRRSVHIVPGSNDRMLRRALELPADALVFDLEDSVTPDNKEAARRAVTDLLAQGSFRGQERIVRMNALETPWAAADLEATMAGRPDAYMVPKARTPADLAKIDSILSRLEQRYGYPDRSVKLMVIATETPQGLLNIKDLAVSPRLDGLTWGAEDLSAAIGARRNRDEHGGFLEVFRYARIMTLLAATAAGIQPLDTVFVKLRDLEGCRQECREAAGMGFTGKLTIHPSQVEIVNEIFSPSAAEVAEAEQLVAAFEENRRAGRMAFEFNGEMVDAPHLERARRILDIASRISRKGEPKAIN